MKRKSKSIAIFATIIAGMLAFTACGNQSAETVKPETPQTEVSESVEEKEVVLTDYVKGLHDWTVEAGAENIDFMKDVTFDNEVVKEVTADSSKVDLDKEGKYDLVYSITPVDDSISKATVTKTVTVKVVSVETAQEEADKGNQVVTSGNEIKKDSNGNTPKPPKEEKPAQKPAEKPSKPDNGGNGGSNKPADKPADKPVDKPADKPADKPSKPSNPGNGNGGGNNGDNKPTTPPAEKPHEHSWVHHDATGHNETVVIKEAWDEPIVEEVWEDHTFCNQCGKDFGPGKEGIHKAGKHLIMSDNCYGYHTKPTYVGEKVTGYKHHEAITEDHWVEDSPAYDECSGCHERK